ncbi:hypothetical protein [Chryseobacterium sp. 'Rf worker isolate 10']|uniref:hypothetical protein n=1 Tax=Chryseobacterium sp. 'Rf worker isolate 10' TaxID=2887348 RepID=UPI003D6F2138
MKTKIVLLFLLGWVGMAFGQENEIILDGNYYINRIIGSDNPKQDNKGFYFYANKKNLNGKYRLTVDRIDGDKVYFSIWRFKDKELTSKISDTEYILPKEEFMTLMRPLYDKIDWRVGFYTMPFKLRFHDFSFDANINLGGNLGAKIRINRMKKDGFALEPMVGVGWSNIKMDDSNSSATSATNIGAFTINTGLLFHITSEINIGLTLGWDNISGNDQKKYDWKYNGKGWLGIGINFSFSKEEKNTGSKDSN